jgi:hypothetical protein
VNFVINVDPNRVIGTVDDLVVETVFTKRQHWINRRAPLHHREVRYDTDTGRTFCALVFEVPEEDE